MRNNNLCFKTDGYKPSHYKQFPKNMTKSSYYMESRSDDVNLLFFGLQAIIKKHLLCAPKHKDVNEANKFYTNYGVPFNKEGWMDIADLGFLPLEIKAVPEGMQVPSQTALLRVENTDDRFGWLPGYLEDLFLHTWYPTTVATISKQCKNVIMDYLVKTGDPNSIMFKLHDFGYRGTSSHESAEIGAMAHLVNFMGTDTIAGILAAQEYYNTTEMLGFSIPAAEHSTITSWLKENETEAYKNMLNQFANPGKILAVVSDSYDFWNAIDNVWGKELKQQVLDSGATLVIRPDSGDPAEVVLEAVKRLDKAFGSELNDKKYKVLNPAVRLLQGDGIDVNTLPVILDTLTSAGYSADNVAVGMGGGLLQQCDRDTFKFAQKMSACVVDGEWRDVYKQPVDAPWKTSKKGRQENPLFRTIFKDGELLIDEDFQTIRDRSNK